MCLPDWARDTQVAGKLCFWDLCEGVPGRDSHLTQETRTEDTPSARWVGLIPSAEGLNRTKGQKCEFVVCVSWAIHLSCPLPSELLDLGPSFLD